MINDLGSILLQELRDLRDAVDGLTATLGDHRVSVENRLSTLETANTGSRNLWGIVLSLLSPVVSAVLVFYLVPNKTSISRLFHVGSNEGHEIHHIGTASPGKDLN